MSMTQEDAERITGLVLRDMGEPTMSLSFPRYQLGASYDEKISLPSIEKVRAAVRAVVRVFHLKSAGSSIEAAVKNLRS